MPIHDPDHLISRYQLPLVSTASKTDEVFFLLLDSGEGKAPAPRGWGRWRPWRRFWRGGRSTRGQEDDQNLQDLEKPLRSRQHHFRRTLPRLWAGWADFSAHWAVIDERFESGSDRVRNFLAAFKMRMGIRDESYRIHIRHWIVLFLCARIVTRTVHKYFYLKLKEFVRWSHNAEKRLKGFAGGLLIAYTRDIFY